MVLEFECRSKTWFEGNVCNSETKKNKPWFKMKLRDSLDCKQGAVRAIRYNIDGDYILTCGSNKTVKLWNAKTFVSTLLINRS